MPSRTYPGYLVAILGVVACSGWVAAWRSGRDPGATGDGASKEDSANGRSKARSESRGASPANFIQDSVTARLLASFGDISASAVPGEVNQKLVHACRGALMDGDVARRERNYSLLLELMRPEDAPALHELFLELHREGRAFGDYKTFAMRWGAIDAPGALKYLQAQVPAIIPRDDFRAITRGWGKTDPAGALKWMDENPTMAANFGGRSSIVEGWMKIDPVAALGWLDANTGKLAPDEYFECIRMALPEQIHGATTDLPGAADWLVSLPDEHVPGMAASHAWNSAQWSLGELPYDRAAEVWGKVGSEPWMGFREFRSFTEVHSNNRSSAEGMDGYLTALEKTWPEDKITAQFQRWTAKDPVATLEWLGSAPESAVTTAAIRGAVQALEETDPATAAEWAKKLEK